MSDEYFTKIVLTSTGTELTMAVHAIKPTYNYHTKNWETRPESGAENATMNAQRVVGVIKHAQPKLDEASSMAFARVLQNRWKDYHKAVIEDKESELNTLKDYAQAAQNDLSSVSVTDNRKGDPEKNERPKTKPANSGWGYGSRSGMGSGYYE